MYDMFTVISNDWVRLLSKHDTTFVHVFLIDLLFLYGIFQVVLIHSKWCFCEIWVLHSFVSLFCLHTGCCFDFLRGIAMDLEAFSVNGVQQIRARMFVGNLENKSLLLINFTSAKR